MTRRRSMVEQVASLPPVSVAGRFFRHAAPNRDPWGGGYDGLGEQPSPLSTWDDQTPAVWRRLTGTSSTTPEFAPT